MSTITQALRGPTVLVPAGVLDLPKSHGRPLRAQIQELTWDQHLVTVGQYAKYLNLADKLGGRFGGVIFSPDCAVKKVVRGRTMNIAMAEHERALDELRRAGMMGVFGSEVIKIAPTVERWRDRFAYLPESGKAYLGQSNPAIFVNWLESVGFANAVGGRLPTELEWHYAALGGKAAAEVEYATADDTLQHAIWKRDIEQGTAPVIGSDEEMSARKNSYGLIDMTGNVWEWTGTSWVLNYNLLKNNPNGMPHDNSTRSLRGGSWSLHDPRRLRVANRYNGLPGYVSNNVGFRVVS